MRGRGGGSEERERERKTHFVISFGIEIVSVV